MPVNHFDHPSACNSSLRIMAEEETDIKFHSTFERKGEFIALQAQLLSKPLDVEPTPDEQHAEAQVLQQLSLIVGQLSIRDA